MRFFVCLLAASFAAAAVAQSQAPALQVGQPFAMGQVRVIPILGEDQPGALEPISLIDASRRGLVKISDPKTTFVTVHNDAKQPLLLLGGEVIVGGHQDQIIQQDYVVMPGQTINAQIYCVEPGRDSGPKDFAATGQLVPDWIRVIPVRSNSGPMGKATAQVDIWNEVQRISINHGLKEGSSIAATVLQPGFMSDLDAVAAKLGDADDKSNTIGMMFVVNGRIFSMDLFSTHKNFEEFRSILLHLYALDASLVAGDQRAPEIGLDSLQACVSDIAAAPRKQVGDYKSTVWFMPLTRAAIGIESGTLDKAGALHGAYFPK